MKTYTAYMYEWYVYERGMGLRPEGKSLNSTRELSEAAKARYESVGSPEHSYEYEAGSLREVRVSQEIHDKILAAELGDGSYWPPYGDRLQAGSDTARQRVVPRLTH